MAANASRSACSQQRRRVRNVWMIMTVAYAVVACCESRKGFAPPVFAITADAYRDGCRAGSLGGAADVAHDAIPMADEKSLWTGLKRGLARRCPNCGEGQL